MESEIKELRESIKKVAIPTTDSLNTVRKPYILVIIFKIKKMSYSM